MLERTGINGKGQTHWKLHVPDEHCMPGLEVGIFATEKGLLIGGNVIAWGELEAARMMAGGNTPYDEGPFSLEDPNATELTGAAGVRVE